jgi:hypothetical protein
LAERAQLNREQLPDSRLAVSPTQSAHVVNRQGAENGR